MPKATSYKSKLTGKVVNRTVTRSYWGRPSANGTLGTNHVTTTKLGPIGRIKEREREVEWLKQQLQGVYKAVSTILNEIL